jgi:hypothetical protein
MLHHLILAIEKHGDEIWSRVFNKVKTASQLGEIRRVPEAYLRAWLEDIPRNLGERLADIDDEVVRKRYVHFGRLCFTDSVPLHEAVNTLHILKREIIGYVRDQGMVQTFHDVYAQDDLRARVGRLFDTLVYRLVLGYEQGLVEHADRMPPMCRLPLPPKSDVEGDGPAGQAVA